MATGKTDFSGEAIARGRYVALDGMRGIAALNVAACHAPYLFGFDFINSTLAVDFFFALSGFVMAHAYGERLRGGMSAGRFAVLRLIRLYPLYALGTILGMVAMASGLIDASDRLPRDVVLWAAPLGALMLPTPVGYVIFPFNHPAWSLFFELAVNVAYGLLHKLTWRWGWIAAGAVGSAAVLIVLVLKLGSADLGWQTVWREGLLGGLARVAFSFTAGIGVYRLHRWRPIRVPAPAWLVGLVLLAILCVPGAPWLAAYQLTCILVVLPVILWIGAGVTVSGRQAAIFSFLGAISYAVYAIHWAVQHLLNHGAIRYLQLDLAQWAPWTGVGYLLLVIALAWVADTVFDRPVRRRLVELTRRKEGKPAPA